MSHLTFFALAVILPVNVTGNEVSQLIAADPVRTLVCASRGWVGACRPETYAQVCCLNSCPGLLRGLGALVRLCRWPNMLLSHVWQGTSAAFLQVLLYC